jgi:hypothetical protein
MADTLVDRLLTEDPDQIERGRQQLVVLGFDRYPLIQSVQGSTCHAASSKSLTCLCFQ